MGKTLPTEGRVPLNESPYMMRCVFSPKLPIKALVAFLSITALFPLSLALKGLFSRENFYFRSLRTNNMEVHQGLVFGCGLENENIHFGLNDGPQNIIAGRFGLNAQPRSFLSQLDAQAHGKFSYCLPPSSQSGLAESTIYYGDDAQMSGDADTQVQTISMRNGDFFYHRLAIDPSVFEDDEADVIDTGLPYTMLVRSAYNPLREAIQRFFLIRYGWLPKRQGGTLDLCYSKYPNMDEREFPTVTLHFLNDEQSGEIDMVLTKDQWFVGNLEFSGDDQGICLTVMPLPIDNLSDSILGAFQQVNFQFLFDVHSTRLSLCLRIVYNIQVYHK